MNGNNPWNSDVWKDINGEPGNSNKPGLLKQAMQPMRIAQYIFRTEVQNNDYPIPADIIDFDTGIPTSGNTRPLATILKSFRLRTGNVPEGGASLSAIAKDQVRLAAQTLALVEDMLFFQGKKASLPSEVTLQGNDIDKLDYGLLGIAESRKQIIQVFPKTNGNEYSKYGTETFNAVVKGISLFARNLQGPPYALILEPAIFGDAGNSLSQDAIITPAKAIREIIENSHDKGHFLMSSGMPEKTGLLVSLGGGGTTLYVGTEPVIEPNSYNDGFWFFTARESIQFHNVDPRSLIKLEFKEKPKSTSGVQGQAQG